MKFKPCNYDYTKFRSGDIFFSHGCDFIGNCIRLGETGKFRWTDSDLSIVNHAGFLLSIYGQIFCAEVAGKGIILNSVDIYRKAGNQIIEVYRPKVFDSKDMMDYFERYIALWVRRKQDSGYDFGGAVTASTWFKKLFPFIKNEKGREFCSEDVYTTMRDRFNPNFPSEWVNNPPNPLQLELWLKHRTTDYTPVKDYKLCIA